MTIEELCILGIQTHHFFEVGSYQKQYIINELGFTEKEADSFMHMDTAQLAVRVCNANLPKFQQLLKDTHKGKKYGE